MSNRSEQAGSASSFSSIKFGTIATLLFVYSFFAESWVALASIGIIGSGQVTGLAGNYLEVAFLYFAFLIGGFALFTGVGVSLKPNFQALTIKSSKWILGAIASVFVISSVTGYIESSNLFSLYKFTYAIAPSYSPLLSIVQNPYFYVTWIGSNAIGEEMIFLPVYLILLMIFGQKLSGQITANGITGAGFAVLHLIKIIVIYANPANPNPITTQAIFFLISAFFVRIALNLFMYYSKQILPAFAGHAGFDMVVASISNVPF